MITMMADVPFRDDFDRYGAILVQQARDLCEELGRPMDERGGAVGNEAPIREQVSAAHTHVANIRSEVPATVDPVAWERTKVDGRTADEIFERLADWIEKESEQVDSSDGD